MRDDLGHHYRVLRFNLFRIPITLRPSFLLVAALLGLFGETDPLFVAAWVVIVFVSILIHEFGHALTARGFGAEVSIELNGIGGLTRWSVPADAFGPGKRALVAFAGSAVGVLFGVVVWVVALQFRPYPDLAAFVLNTLVFVNVFWGLLNWLPIRPLDGGHLLESLLEKVAPNRGDSIARVVYIATAAAGLAAALQFRLIFVAVIAGWLLLMEFSRGRPQSTGPLPAMSYDAPEEDLPLPETRIIDIEPEPEPDEH